MNVTKDADRLLVVLFSWTVLSLMTLVIKTDRFSGVLVILEGQKSCT